MNKFTPEDYRLAVSGEGPLAAEWDDKPHRLVYALASRVEVLEKALRELVDLWERTDISTYHEDIEQARANAYRAMFKRDGRPETGWDMAFEALGLPRP